MYAAVHGSLVAASCVCEVSTAPQVDLSSFDRGPACCGIALPGLPLSAACVPAACADFGSASPRAAGAIHPLCFQVAAELHIAERVDSIMCKHTFLGT